MPKVKNSISFFILLIVVLFNPLNVKAQSKYADGFNVGYKKGYCFEKQNCIAPLPPPTPAISVGESYDSYQDGYNKGFKNGLDAQNNSSTGSSSNGRYKTTSAAPIDYAYKAPESKINELVAKNSNAIFDKIMMKAQEYYDNGNYQECISACQDATQIAHLVSYTNYQLIAQSYEKLGKKGKAKRYYEKANQMLKNSP
jgi:tetratricopeptide (TPR) repeat protein